MKIEEKTILWKPISEYTGGRVLATNGLDILVGELNPEGDCVSEDCSGIHLCGITHFAKIAGFFPELKESEDERIRKAMIKGLSSCGTKYWGGFEVQAAIAWLEEQGERKPTDWGRDDEQNLNAALGYIRDEYLCRWLKDTIYNKYEKPADWSDEDETRLTNIIIMLKEGASRHFIKDDITKAIDWLKSLKPQNHWKPTEAQLASLRIACDRNDRVGFDLTQLLKELKEL